MIALGRASHQEVKFFSSRLSLTLCARKIRPTFPISFHLKEGVIATSSHSAESKAYKIRYRVDSFFWVSEGLTIAFSDLFENADSLFQETLAVKGFVKPLLCSIPITLVSGPYAGRDLASTQAWSD